jgi:hypothetical protein
VKRTIFIATLLMVMSLAGIALAWHINSVVVECDGAGGGEGHEAYFANVELSDNGPGTYTDSLGNSGTFDDVNQFTYAIDAAYGSSFSVTVEWFTEESNTTDAQWGDECQPQEEEPTTTTTEDKVTICHAAGLDGTTHYETLTIGWSAVYGPAGHFYENGTPQTGHEQDYLGECEEIITTTTTTVPPTTTTTQQEPTTTTTQQEEPPTESGIPQTTTTAIPFDELPKVETDPPVEEPLTVALEVPPARTELPFTGDLTMLVAGLTVVTAVGGFRLLKTKDNN